MSQEPGETELPKKISVHGIPVTSGHRAERVISPFARSSRADVAEIRWTGRLTDKSGFTTYFPRKTAKRESILPFACIKAFCQVEIYERLPNARKRQTLTQFCLRIFQECTPTDSVFNNGCTSLSSIEVIRSVENFPCDLWHRKSVRRNLNIINIKSTLRFYAEEI